MIIIICAWCSKKLGEYPGGEGISHGICQDCKDRTVKELNDERYLLQDNQRDLPGAKML